MARGKSTFSTQNTMTVRQSILDNTTTVKRQKQRETCYCTVNQLNAHRYCRQAEEDDNQLWRCTFKLRSCNQGFPRFPTHTAFILC